MTHGVGTSSKPFPDRTVKDWTDDSDDNVHVVEAPPALTGPPSRDERVASGWGTADCQPAGSSLDNEGTLEGETVG